MRALLAIAAMVCLGLPGFAQERDRKDRSKPTFAVPDPGTQSNPEKSAPQEDPVAQAIDRLVGWPSDKSRRAAEWLIVQKEKSLDLVRKVLISELPKDAPKKPGAAYVIGRIGVPTDFRVLILDVSEKQQQRFAKVFLESAWKLDPKNTIKEAFRFFLLSDSTLRHETLDFVRDRITKDNLGQVTGLLDDAKTDRPFARVIGLDLLDRLVQKKDISWKDAGPRLYKSLGDGSPQVAREAMLLLASRNEAANVAELNQLIVQEPSYWRQRAYAALALSLLGDAYKVEPLQPKTIQTLCGEAGLEHPREMLCRASAALALAQAALRSGDPKLSRLLDREIPITLIDAVGASDQHYLDFASVMPLAYSMLHRITGQDFADYAPVWAQWWRDHGSHFRARRELVEVDPQDLPQTSVDLMPPGGKAGDAIRLSAVAATKPTFLQGRAYSVPQKELKGLIDLLTSSGFFKANEADPNKVASDAALVTVRVDDLARRVAYAGDEKSRPLRDRIVNQVQKLASEYSWQRWWNLDAQPSWPLFFAENEKWFRTHPDPAARADRLRAMIGASLDDVLQLDARVEAVRTLRKLPGGPAALTKTEVKELLAAMKIEQSTNAFVAAGADLLLDARGPAVADDLVACLADKLGPDTETLLVHVFASLPVAKVGTLAADPRIALRKAAVAALAKMDPASAKPLLLQRLGDKVATVRAAAAEALARTGDSDVLPALATLARSASTEIRASAAFSYGLLNTPASRTALPGLLYGDPQPDVRIRAIDGLAASHRPEAADLLLGVFTKESDIRVRAEAATALVALENKDLVARLIHQLGLTPSSSPMRVALVNVLARMNGEGTAQKKQLTDTLKAVLAGDDPASADAAALGLARRWDESALPQLVKMLRERRSAFAALRHLQLLTSRAFDSSDYAVQAKNYEAWALTAADGSPVTWFRDALAERGYSVGPLASRIEGHALADAAVPLLLRALRDPAWYVQSNASRLLSEKMGKGAPEAISYLDAPKVKEAKIQAYLAWWRGKEEARRKAERG